MNSLAFNFVNEIFIEMKDHMMRTTGLTLDSIRNEASNKMYNNVMKVQRREKTERGRKRDRQKDGERERENTLVLTVPLSFDMCIILLDQYIFVWFESLAIISLAMNICACFYNLLLLLILD